MRRTGPLLSSALLALALSTLACADNDDGDDARQRPSTTQRAAKNDLAAPIHPTCATNGFAKPQTRKITGQGASLWTLTYRRNTPPKPRQATTIILSQTSPNTPTPKPDPGTTQKTIAGHQTTYRPPTKRAPLAIAQWKTNRALYSLITNNADTTTLRRLIGCLP